MPRMLCRVNGKAVKEEGFETHAIFGHAAAQDCAVLGSDQPAHCGGASELSLVPAGPLADHRAFLGSEKVHAHVRGAFSAEASSSARRAESATPVTWLYGRTLPFVLSSFMFSNAAHCRQHLSPVCVLVGSRHVSHTWWHMSLAC